MNGFTFFRNYYEAVSDPGNELTLEEQGAIYNAIFAYMFDDTEPDLRGASKMAFNLLRVSLDRSKIRSAAGKLGVNSKQTASKTESSDEQTASKTESSDEQTESKKHFATDLPLLEKKEGRSKKYEETREVSKKKNINYSSSAGARETYDELMTRWRVGPMLRAALGQFIQHCALNGRTLTNDKLENIIDRLFDWYGYPEIEEGKFDNKIDQEQADEVYRAINGGYFDIKVGRK